MRLAFATGMLRVQTRSTGLPFGDCACLALAQRLGAEAITANRRWVDLSLDVRLRLIR